MQNESTVCGEASKSSTEKEVQHQKQMAQVAIEEQEQAYKKLQGMLGERLASEC